MRREDVPCCPFKIRSFSSHMLLAIAHFPRIFCKLYITASFKSYDSLFLALSPPFLSQHSRTPLPLLSFFVSVSLSVSLCDFPPLSLQFANFASFSLVYLSLCLSVCQAHTSPEIISILQLQRFIAYHACGPYKSSTNGKAISIVTFHIDFYFLNTQRSLVHETNTCSGVIVLHRKEHLTGFVLQILQITILKTAKSALL